MRKTAAKKRYLAPDPKFQDKEVTRFVNNLMWQGKKSISFRIFYDAIEMVDKQVEEEEGIDVFRKAVNNITPQLEVRSRRVGGATFQIPTEIRQDRKRSVAMKWLIKYARDRRGKSMAEKLAAEIVAAYKNEGGAIKKKEDTHRMADANKAFAHFRA